MHVVTFPMLDQTWYIVYSFD